MQVQYKINCAGDLWYICNMGFWKNVDDECSYRGISRKELAATVHFSVHTISSGIKRDGMPEADLALRISQALGVPLEKLLCTQSCTAIENYEQAEQQKLLSAYLPYIQKLEQMPQKTKKSILELINNI